MIRFIHLRRAVLLMTVFAALLLAGCAPSVVGKWEGNMAKENPMGITANGSFEFKPDGTFEQKVTAGNAVGTGKYTVQGDKINLKLEDMKIGGKSLTSQLPPDAAKKILSVAEQNGTFKIENDKLTLDTDKGKVTLSRAKP